ncbi:hypothetical protein GCM10010234_54550 [Streptomyces hawaiiensis]
MVTLPRRDFLHSKGLCDVVINLVVPDPSGRRIRREDLADPSMDASASGGPPVSHRPAGGPDRRSRPPGQDRPVPGSLDSTTF